jgi:site-specific DNA-methyltransferase (adenine-specific)
MVVKITNPTKSNNVYGKTCSLISTTVESLINLGFKPNERVKCDGIKFLKRLPSNSIPCIIFDPQYRGVLDKLDYGNEGERQKGRSTLIQMDDIKIFEFFKEINRVLVPSGHLFLWVDKFHLIEGFKNWMGGTDLIIVDHITWNKKRMGMGYRSRRVSEHLIVIQKSPKKAKGVWCIHNIPDVWDETVNSNHPHGKPIKLQSALISAVTRCGDVVVDPAAGSFSVMESAKNVGRVFIGCDLEG